MAVTPIPLRQQVACVQREIRMRERVYPRWVQAGRISQAQADAEIAAMKAVEHTLLSLVLSASQGVLL